MFIKWSLLLYYLNSHLWLRTEQKRIWLEHDVLWIMMYGKAKKKVKIIYTSVTYLCEGCFILSVPILDPTEIIVLITYINQQMPIHIIHLHMCIYHIYNPTQKHTLTYNIHIYKHAHITCAHRIYIHTFLHIQIV